METKNNSKASEKQIKADTDMYMKVQDIKTNMLLYLFIALEWITGPLKDREENYTTGIGLS